LTRTGFRTTKEKVRSTDTEIEGGGPGPNFRSKTANSWGRRKGR